MKISLYTQPVFRKESNFKVRFFLKFFTNTAGNSPTSSLAAYSPPRPADYFPKNFQTSFLVTFLVSKKTHLKRFLELTRT